MATINEIGIPEAGNGILQPLIKNRWRVTFTNIGSASADSKDVSMQAITVSRPVLQFDEIQLDRYNSRAWVAAKHTFEPMNMTLEADVAGRAAEVIQQQIEKQQLLTGASGPWLATAAAGSIYKFATKISMLDGNEEVVETWIMEGCWIQNVDWTELDYSASEAVQIVLTIRYDNARQKIEGTQSTGVATGGAGS